MGWQQIVIDEGRYVAFLGDGEWLEFPLVDNQTGEAAAEDYSFKGAAWVEDGLVSIEAASGAGPGYGGIRCWKLLGATRESLDYLAGLRHGRKQQRRREPGEQRGAAFYRGWRAAWDEKRDASRAKREY